MIKLKHFMDPVESDDGMRVWVEPFRLTTDFRKWCNVDRELCEISPPLTLWRWFEAHPDGYEFFRAQYHEYLDSHRQLRPGLHSLALASMEDNLTLLHQGDNPAENSGTALYEFLSELGAHSSRD